MQVQGDSSKLKCRAIVIIGSKVIKYYDEKLTTPLFETPTAQINKSGGMAANTRKRQQRNSASDYDPIVIMNNSCPLTLKDYHSQMVHFQFFKHQGPTSFQMLNSFRDIEHISRAPKKSESLQPPNPPNLIENGERKNSLVSSENDLDLKEKMSLPRRSCSMKEEKAPICRPSLTVRRSHERTQSLSIPISSNSSLSPAASYLSGIAMGASPVDDNFDEGDIVGDYVIGKLIGLGSFSECRQLLTSDNRKLAVKIVKKGSDESAYTMFEKELMLWRKLSHKHILPLVDVVETEEAILAISPLAEQGHLLSYLIHNGPFSEDSARELFKQLASAVFYLHEEVGVLHRDIKLENILRNKNGDIWLTDFGLSEYLNDITENIVFEPETAGSFGYCAPEEFEKKIPLSKYCDMWSLGVVLFAIMTATLPFADDFFPRLQMSILKGSYHPLPDHLSQELVSLIKGLLTVDCKQRLTIREVLNHPWLCK